MSSGRYQASHPSWYRRRTKERHNFGHATTVADSVGDVPRTGLQPEQKGRYQYHEQSSQQQERYYRQQQEQSLSPTLSPPGAIQDQRPDVLPYPTDGTFQSESMNTTDEAVVVAS